MRHQKWFQALAVMVCLLAAPSFIKAQSPAAGNPPVIAVTTERPLTDLLPDKLAGIKATSEVKQYNADDLGELVGGGASMYREYYMTRAASREYGAARVEIFQSSHPFGAFGLVSFYGSIPNSGPNNIGAGSVLTTAGLIFWKNKYLVQVTAASGKTHISIPGDTALARALANALPTLKPDERPVLFHSLPDASRASSQPRYFLGPETLNMVVADARRLYTFNGDAEAVVAEYEQKPAVVTGRGVPVSPPMKLLIIEYHTPQFAYDAINRANEYVNSLSEDERQRVIIKREGNYIVEAVNFNDRAAAQAIVDAVQYPYGVQWLHHPSIPSPDPFRAQKAAQMLLSTFGLLGVLLGSVLVAGGVVGTTMFLKRRKRMQAAFSDAGQMLRLKLDPFEETILGLPPKRD